jgi:3',5'-cyclic AMP phosphodiesterase CpdA
MGTIVQLSDLHFGRTDPKVVEALRNTVIGLRPDVVVVSGDLTQRAKYGQFVEAAEFLKTLPQPQIVVPGNHDISLYNIWRRFRKPLKGFQKFITSNPFPVYRDAEIAVMGLNTARSLIWKGGRVSNKQIEDTKEYTKHLEASAIKIVASHHPLTQVRSPRALEGLMRLGVDVFLSGHLHKSSAASLVRNYENIPHSAIMIGAGTASSVRYRDELNSFNLISVNAPLIKVECFSFQHESRKFAVTAQSEFIKKAGEWKES